MIRSYIIVLFALFTDYSFCGKDFVALGRHQWRCKQRVHSNSTGPDRDITSLLSETQFLLFVILMLRLLNVAVGSRAGPTHSPEELQDCKQFR